MPPNHASAIIRWRNQLDELGGGFEAFDQSATVSTMLFGCHSWASWLWSYWPMVNNDREETSGHSIGPPALAPSTSTGAGHERIVQMRRVTPFVIALSGIVVILLAIVVGPIFSPPGFSWLRHSTSEQAGQHMPGAWIMRAGFVAYGLGTLLAALSEWPPRSMVRSALALFGLGLIGTAIWSNAPILPNLTADMHEDWLHSVASGIVGAAFAAACAARLFAPGGSRYDFLAWVCLVVSVAFPLAMAEFPEFRGALQRAMFAVSFAFVAREFKASVFRIFTPQ